jgi:hypothetical protein
LVTAEYNIDPAYLACAIRRYRSLVRRAKLLALATYGI